MNRATPKDLGLALLVGFLVAQGPLTPAALLPSLAAGIVAAGLFLLYRMRQPRAARSEAAPVERWEVPWIVRLALGALVVAAWPTGVWMYGQWTGSVWHNTHGLLIPVLMVLLSRNILRRLEPPPDERADAPSAWGFACVLPGLAMLALDSAADTRYLGAAGIILVLPGLSLLLLGVRRTRALALPLVLGAFMLPLPNTLASQVYLRTVTANAVGPLLTMIGIPTFVDHSVLEVAGASFLVANTCSGFSTLYATIAMAVLLGTLSGSRIRQLIVWASVIPLALGANVVRVFILVLIFLYVDPNLLDTSAHAASGVATFFAVLGVLIVLSDRPSLARALL